MLEQEDDATHRGSFLSLDGPDGGGKTTQAARLVEWLRQEGHEVVACRDPGGTPLGERLRDVLLERSTVTPTVRAEMLLYMASRAQLVEEVIRPALQAGKFVVCDRFLLANVAYQGHAAGLPVADLWDVGRVATGGLMPDLTLLLDVSPELAMERVGKPRDRMEDHPEEYRRRVRAGFLEAARSYRWPLVIVDASRGPDDVALTLQSEVARALGSRARS
jgi:dTMP kinase